jgi:hypothetical protein
LVGGGDSPSNSSLVQVARIRSSWVT